MINSLLRATRFAVVLWLLPAGAMAQNYNIDWYKVAGGGTSTGRFWSLIAVVQTPGAPTLCISQSGSTVTVYWQAVAGWSLQQNSNLALPAGWSVNSTWTTSNGTNYLNLTLPTGNLFFRLKQPQ